MVDSMVEAKRIIDKLHSMPHIEAIQEIERLEKENWAIEYLVTLWEGVVITNIVYKPAVCAMVGHMDLDEWMEKDGRARSECGYCGWKACV